MQNSSSAVGDRINKYLASCGLCSRREADQLIDQGRVRINGQMAKNGDRVRKTDVVEVDGKCVTPRAGQVVLAYYKPVGVTCTTKDAHAEKTLNDVIHYPVRVTYAGRLDRDSEGLLLLTDDGELVDKLMRGAYGHEKEYIVRVDRPINESFLEQMARGVYLKELDITTRPCEIIQEGKYVFRIVLTQGLNRQIRRMCSTLGFHVRTIKRVRVANILLGDLNPGELRELDENERIRLYEIAGVRTEKK